MLNVIRWVAMIVIGFTLLPFAILMFVLGVIVMLAIYFFEAIGINCEVAFNKLQFMVEKMWNNYVCILLKVAPLEDLELTKL